MSVAVIYLTAIFIIVLAARYIYLRKQSERLSEIIRCIKSYKSKNKHVCEGVVSAIPAPDDSPFVDIATDLEISFENSYITFSQKEDFTRYYTEFYKKADSLVRKLKSLLLKPSAEIEKLILDFKNIDQYV